MSPLFEPTAPRPVLTLAIAFATLACAGVLPSSLAAQAPTTSAQQYSEADIRFVRGMIAHHAQALDMAALVPSRTERRDLRLLAERIAVSQKDEIAFMQHWLTDRGIEAPAPGHHRLGTLMPGMLTAAEMTGLEQAGPAFAQLFLAGMIRHHQGAITMVAELFTAGGGHESALFRFASDVDVDQRAEIRRMQALLQALTPR